MTPDRTRIILDTLLMLVGAMMFGVVCYFGVKWWFGL